MLGGLVAYRFASSRRLMAQRHMRRVLGPESANTAARQLFASYGRYWAEFLWVRPRRMPGVASRIRTEGLDMVEEAKRAGRGIIFALPHMGNWEMAVPVARLLGIEVLAVAEKLHNRWLTGWLTRLRQDLGINIALSESGTGLIGRLEQAIAQGWGVALLCDRDLRGRGTHVTFFGEATTLPSGPVSLALRTGASLFPVGTFFHDGGHFVRILAPIDLPRDQGRATTLRLGTQMLADRLEELIRHAPEQWHLVQPNWPSDRQ
jgi:KDO2-lipid IV(A) lauroyltransferase